MGTNYYYEPTPITPTAKCSCCGRQLRCGACEADARVHIGKSSAGWRFLFHATPEIRTFEAWKARIGAGGRIVDQYGKECTLAELEKTVMFRAQIADCLDHKAANPFDASYFRDPEGHVFKDGEFS